MTRANPASINIVPVLVADVLAEGQRMPVYLHVIDHPDARVLVDTGMTKLHRSGSPTSTSRGDPVPSRYRDVP